MKFDKGDDNPKMIKKISIAEKSILGDPRNTVIKVELNDNTTDSEYKVSPSVTFTAKDKDVPSGADKFQAGDKITVELKFWIGNVGEGADQDYMAGDDGVVLKLSLIHISEPTRLGMISYAVFCLKKKKNICSQCLLYLLT